MNTVLKIENLYKEYILGVIGHGTLYRDMQSWWANLRGKEDPNSLIGNFGKNKIRDQILALKEINLEVKEGEVLGIIGSNGAGKSTLLKVLSRVTAPSSGEIKIRGRIASLLEVGTGFHSELTGRENIYLNGAINGMNKQAVDKKLDEIVDFSGVEVFLDTHVKRYSSGMYVRLGFAIAAHLDPEILVVDEVLAVGDASFQKKAIGKMQDVSKDEGRTVLFVSHNLESIKMLCTRSILMQKGQIVKSGSSEDVVNFYLENAVGEETGPVINFSDLPEKDFQILNFMILDEDGEKSSRLDRTKPFKLVAEYVVRKESKELDLNFSICTASNENGVSSNTSVLQWSNRHYRRYKFNDENICLKPGNYRVAATLPGYILNSGKYNFFAHLTYAESVFYQFNKQPILFELFDLGSSHTSKRGGRSSGLIAMPLEWDVKVKPL